MYQIKLFTIIIRSLYLKSLIYKDIFCNVGVDIALVYSEEMEKIIDSLKYLIKVLIFIK